MSQTSTRALIGRAVAIFGIVILALSVRVAWIEWPTLFEVCVAVLEVTCPGPEAAIAAGVGLVLGSVTFVLGMRTYREATKDEGSPPRVR